MEAPIFILFLFYAIVAFGQAAFVIWRSRTGYDAGSLHMMERCWITIGLVGNIILAVGTGFDNLRNFADAFPDTWPTSVQLAPNASAATVAYRANEQGFRSFLFYVCDVTHEVLASVAIMGSLVGLMRLRQIAFPRSWSPEHLRLWFGSSLLLSSVMAIASLAGFIIGPASVAPAVKRELGVNVATVGKHNPLGDGLLCVQFWVFLILVIMVGLSIADKPNRCRNSGLAVVVLISIVLLAVANSKESLYVLANLGEQLAIAVAIFVHETYVKGGSADSPTGQDALLYTGI